MRLAATSILVMVLTGVSPEESRGDQGISSLGAPSPSSRTTASDWQQGRANPYSRLFQAPRQPATPEKEMWTTRSDRAPIVICGMTLIPVDPRIDSGIATPRLKAQQGFTIRGVEPPICR